MQPGTATVVGILAGGGALPREIADAVRGAGGRVVIVGLEGEADAATFLTHDITLVNWGQIGRMIRTFKAKGVTDLVIVGRVSRPDLSRIRTDLGFWSNLPRILRIMAAGGDDNVLRRVVRFFEGHGFRVRGPAEVAPVLVIGEGPLGRHRMSAADGQDVARGREVVARLAAFDIGQAVVVTGGRVVAIEAVEGTDAMLERVAGRHREPGGGGVLVKRPKPGQELRVDMPAIGPETVARVVAAGLSGIAVEAGATLAANRAELLRRADEHGIFVVGVSPGPVAASVKRASSSAGPDADAGIGARVLHALTGLTGSRGVVVVRRHVLAVEAGEGVPALVARAAGLRQWGRKRRGRRRGALVVAALADLRTDDIAAAASAGFERILALDAGGVDSGTIAGLNRMARSLGVEFAIAPGAGSGGGS